MNLKTIAKKILGVILILLSVLLILANLVNLLRLINGAFLTDMGGDNISLIAYVFGLLIGFVVMMALSVIFWRLGLKLIRNKKPVLDMPVEDHFTAKE
jgi:phosphoglycerol transferase MdoB-like AlkP superfamily enzyme